MAALIKKVNEICEKYLSKGDKIYVEGRIKSRQWQAEDGTTKSTIEIQVTEFTFLNVKKDADANRQLQDSESKNTTFDNLNSPIENDLPF